MRKTFKRLMIWVDGWCVFEFLFMLLTVWVKELKTRLSEYKQVIKLRAFTGISSGEVGTSQDQFRKLFLR
ncbi:hypothetical protein [Paenibacillus sp. BT-177]|uniref:hypothetical protein n=1 Tax=Paenibacillus sp. BT-177 TaxID=2986930 RepID=UPI0021F6B05E|nr:hypothetical protein [Paenibacillus sp. BT-177]